MVWKDCRGYQEEEQEKKNGTWRIQYTEIIARILYVNLNGVEERDYGIPDLMTLVFSILPDLEFYLCNFILVTTSRVSARVQGLFQFTT